MHCIFKGAIVIDPSSAFNRKQVDIRIQNGKIVEIAAGITASDAEVFDMQGKHVSIGWMDMLCAFGDPGFEYRETITTGTNAAAKGGFTAVGLMPNTQPTLHSKAEIEYIRNTASGTPVHVYPYGAITHNREGKELTEIYDMHAAGAKAFTDAEVGIRDAGILLRSLQYVLPFKGVVIDIPNDHKIVGNANVNEGKMSVELGMYGIPDILEELMVIRDIKMAEYTGSNLHLGAISCAKSIHHIREAKSKGIPVTAGVAAYQLYFDESELHDYNAHFKVNPPLRDSKDKEALRTAVADGTIDVICSFHLPHDADAKDVEFEYAAFGMASLEAMFGAARMVMNGLSLESLLEKFTTTPRRILQLPMPSISVGAEAELTFFDPDIEWELTQADVRSKSANNAFVGKLLKGKPTGIFNKGKFKSL